MTFIILIDAFKKLLINVFELIIFEIDNIFLAIMVRSHV